MLSQNIQKLQTAIEALCSLTTIEHGSPDSFLVKYIVGSLKDIAKSEAGEVNEYGLSQAEMQDIEKGYFIDAVKNYRQRTGAYLKDAKAAVDNALEKLGLSMRDMDERAAQSRKAEGNAY